MSTTTVLIVEDEAVVAADLADRLKRNGYTVWVAASGEEALSIARQRRPKLALMDIELHGRMDGVEIAQVLRRELDVSVIFLSAHSDEETLKRAKLSDPSCFLVKPFEESELQINIEIALDRHERERQIAAADQAIRRLNAKLEQDMLERTAELAASLFEIEGVVHAVAHHLRSPLRAMEGYSHLLLTQYAAHLPDSALRFPEAIASNARRMARLVDDLLSFISLRLQPLYSTRIDIAAVARDVLDMLIAAEPGRPVEAHVDQLPACQADRVLLRRLLVELLSNALKFTRDRQPVIITVGSRPGTAETNQHVYFVRDNGIGFDSRYADKLFKLF
jgi:signal transduction histidine kinase